MAICNNCGAQLMDGEAYCGHCGAKVDQYWNPQDFQGGHPYGAGPYYPQPAPVSGMAIASLVLGIATWVVGWFTLGIPGILGIIFGLLGIVQCKNGQRTGRGLAIAGFILSVIMVALLIGIFVFAFSLIGDAFEVIYEMPSVGYFY